MLTQTERTTLLHIARGTIESRLRNDPFADPAGLSEALRRPAGSFVTLRKRGDLRGCIGSIIPISPLHRAVAESALNAAFRDPRFSPLSLDELPQIAIEISVLGPIERIDDLASIVVGRDGLIVRKGDFSGLLLPQVAIEQQWDRDTFLSHTCYKAGLPPDEWQKGRCIVERFPAEVFAEDSLNQ